MARNVGVAVEFLNEILAVLPRNSEDRVIGTEKGITSGIVSHNAFPLRLCDFSCPQKEIVINRYLSLRSFILNSSFFVTRRSHDEGAGGDLCQRQNCVFGDRYFPAIDLSSQVNEKQKG